MRDFEIYQNDLIVGTHGRGIWVLEDLSPLRQINDTVLGSEAYLFQPADAVLVNQGGDEGTPLQKDEPQAANPPSGAIIDYYLKEAAAGPVTLEILDQGGAVLRSFSSAAPPAIPAGRPGIPNTSPLWRTTPEPFSVAAGLHRVVWSQSGGGRGFGGAGGGATRSTGTFTARLTVNGKSYTQTFVVLPDPRQKAS